MTPKEAYAVFLLMSAIDPLLFAKAVASEKEYPEELRRHAKDYVNDPKTFLSLVV
jgi:hypothetical protein